MEMVVEENSRRETFKRTTPVLCTFPEQGLKLSKWSATTNFLYIAIIKLCRTGKAIETPIQIQNIQTKAKA